MLFFSGCEREYAVTPDREPGRLPAPVSNGNMSVEEAISMRRSVREYADEPLSIAEISQILWAAQGISKGRLRTVPSAGALYPLKLYIVCGDTADIAPGVYEYEPSNHRIYLVAGGDMRDELYAAAMSQPPVKTAPASLVIAADFDWTTGKYGERGKNYVYMEAGHAAQNVYLQAVSLGLGTVSIGAFDDAAIQKTVGMGNGETPLYIMPVGRPSEGQQKNPQM